MKTIKVSEATNAQLDWLVYECEKRAGRTDVYMRWFGDGRKDAPWCNGPFHPSTDWAQGGPIIEREHISTTFQGIIYGEHWWASLGDPTDEETMGYTGPTPLIAAMRCYVASKLGETVEVPEELT
jgi:hypothetical protein